MVNLIYYGIIFTVPMTLVKVKIKTNSEDFVSLIILGLVQIPAVLISAYSVDIKILGRKNSMVISFLLCGICLILVFFL